jgi:nicotinamide-nucleotide amidase
MTEEVCVNAARQVLVACRARDLKIVTAESCTGGLVAAALTDIPGSSDVVDRGYITYSDAAKQDMLGVSVETLQRYGAVSRETVEAMVRGALARSSADLAVAVTGIAGPAGGSATSRRSGWPSGGCSRSRGPYTAGGPSTRHVLLRNVPERSPLRDRRRVVF